MARLQTTPHQPARGTRSRPQRWTTITAVADRLVDPDKAAVLAAELDGQGLVRVGGGHTKTIGEAALAIAEQVDV